MSYKKRSSSVAPPVADVRPHEVVSPQGTRTDPYYWLRDDTRSNKDVLGYIAAENRYSTAMLAPTERLQKQLFNEIVARIKEDESTVPVLDDGYWYYARFVAQKQYMIHARRKGAMDAPEEVLFDVNKLAKGHEFYRLGAYEVSPDGKWLAYTEDTVGRNQFVLRIRNLKTGEHLADTASNIGPSLVWGNDSETVFYIGKEAETLRPYRVVRHVLRTDPSTDVVVHQEDDESFYTFMGKSKSKQYVLIVLSSTTMTEVRIVDADKPRLPAAVFHERERDHEYSLDHLDGRFVIRSNWQAKNFRLMQVQDGAERGDRKLWRELVPHSPDVFVSDFALYHQFVGVSVRSGGLRKVRVLPNGGGEPFTVKADEPAYTMYLRDTPNADSDSVRYIYSSMTTPDTTYEMAVATQKRVQLKREAVLGDFDPANYVTEYVHATARDGVKVPVSIVYKKTTPIDGTAPLLQYAYGSYGLSTDPSFSSPRLSLLDRGVVYVIAHIRGGQELGRRWYEDGKLLNKMNTFTDFIDVTKFVVDKGYGAKDKILASGGSAGGLLMGAVINMAPQLYRGIVTRVPFVDVVTTMLDESIPLTTNEFDEWGNPKLEKYYEYMLSYSPYDNVSKQDYPSMLVTTGLWDSQVQYYEPTKWVAKLRAHKTDDNPLLLHVNMDAGHGGKSGRYHRYENTARNYAFFLHVLNTPDRRN